MRLRRVREGLLSMAALLLVQLGASVWAAEWAAEPSVSWRTELNDNVQFTPNPPKTVWANSLSPEVNFSGKTETLEVLGGMRFNFNRYAGEDELNTNDKIFKLHSRYLGERGDLGAEANFTEDSTLTSERETTGVVFGRRQRTSWSIAPFVSRSLNERSQVGLNYNYNSVSYGPGTGLGFIDYRDQTATGNYQYGLSERDLATAAAGYERFETKDGRFQARSYSAQLGLTHGFSETLRGDLTLGVRTTKSTLAPQFPICTGPVLFGVCFGTIETVTATSEGHDTGYLLNAGLNKKWMTAEVNARLSRSLNPTSIGQITQTDRLDLTLGKSLSDTLTVSVGTSLYRNRFTGIQQASGRDERLYRIEPKLSWRFSPWWTLDTGYARYEERFTNTDTSVTQNLVYLLLRYSPARLSMSR